MKYTYIKKNIRFTTMSTLYKLTTDISLEHGRYFCLAFNPVNLIIRLFKKENNYT